MAWNLIGEFGQESGTRARILIHMRRHFGLHGCSRLRIHILISLKLMPTILRELNWIKTVGPGISHGLCWVDAI
jgi:hypothetical protein